jgi:predicted TIM-barrel fold metal-dependent hydrolase
MTDARQSPQRLDIHDSTQFFFEAGVPVDFHEPGAGEAASAYLVPELQADLATTPQVTKTIYMQAFSWYRTDGPEEMRPVGETEHVERMTREHRDRIAAGIIGYADLGLGRAVEPVLEAHREAGRGRFVGVRRSVVWDADPSVVVVGPASLREARSARNNAHLSANLMHDGAMLEGLELLGEMGLPYETTIRLPQLADLADLAKACPGTTIVLGHTGGFTYAGRFNDDREATNAEWREGMERLAACSNVHVKLGGMGDSAKWEWVAAGSPDGPVRVSGIDETMEFDAEGRLLAQVSADMLVHVWSDRIRWCIDTFGSERCMIEGNFPPNRRLASWRSHWDAFDRITAHLSDEDRRNVFSGTTARVFSI